MLAKFALLHDVVHARLGELLVPLVDFLDFKSTEHVVTRVTIDCANKLRIWVANFSNGTELKAQNGAQVDFQMSHSNSLAVVFNLVSVLINLFLG